MRNNKELNLEIFPFISLLSNIQRVTVEITNAKVGCASCAKQYLFLYAWLVHLY